MKKNLATIAAGNKKCWNVIIETTKGNCHKYRYNTELEIFELTEILSEGLLFPHDFGFIPSTLGQDGDPLDVLLLTDHPTFAGCLVPSRLIGVIEAQQTEKDGASERNDRLVAVPDKSHRYGKVESLKQMDKKWLDELCRFFITYNQELGKKFKVLNLRGPNHAESLLRDGRRRFAKHHRPRAKSSGRK